MYWNCPHCDTVITNRTLKSVKHEDGRRALQCPSCGKDIEMNVHPAEYWQLAIPAVGFVVLWFASKSGSQNATALAGGVIMLGLGATFWVKKHVLGPWRRFRIPGDKR